QVWLFVMTALLGVLTIVGVVQPWVLLVITLAIGAASAIDLPAWLAIVPDVVSPEDVPASVTLGTFATNIARVVGPAIPGVIIVTCGPRAVFLSHDAVVACVFV